MRTLSITLSDEMAGFIDEELRRGAYRDAGELIGESLDLLRHNAASDEEKLAILRHEVQLGLDDMKAGRFSDRTIEEIARDVLSDTEREV